MVHSQAPETILKDQDWPISVEAQFLAGNRTTMNVCTPGTEIFMKGVDGEGALHQLHDQALWRRGVGSGRGGSARLDARAPPHRRPDGAAVRTADDWRRRRHGFDPAIKKDGTLLDEGYIGLQAESQPVEFRNIRLLNLSGCMNPASRAYRPYFVHRDDSRCSKP